MFRKISADGAGAFGIYLKMLKRIHRFIDRCGIRLAGTAYICFSRDAVLNERFRYAISVLRNLRAPSFKLLDVGCGSGFLLGYLDRELNGRVTHYIGIDRHAADLSWRFKGIATPHQFFDVDLDNEWDFGRADIVICLEVIEHLMDDDGLMEKLARSVAPGGHLLLTTPNLIFVDLMGEKIAGFADISSTQDGGHVRRGYDRAQLTALVKKHGLIPESFGWISRFSPEGLRHYLSSNSPIGYILHNIFHRRPDFPEGFIHESDDLTQTEQYWSIAIVCRKE